MESAGCWYVNAPGHSPVLISPIIFTPKVLANSPKTIIHDIDDHDGVSLIGAYPGVGNHESDAELLEFPRTRVPPLALSGIYAPNEQSLHFSSAQLPDVAHAEVFRRGRGPYCRGILFTYKNGCQRALGDCRLGLDPSQRYREPELLCTAHESKQNPRNGDISWSVRVHFKVGYPHEHDTKGWVSYDMARTSDFWVTHAQQYLKVVADLT